MQLDISSQLFPNPLTFIVQLLATLIIFLFMKKFLFKHVRNFLRQRQDMLNAKLKEADDRLNESKIALAKANEEILKSKELADQILNNADKKANEYLDNEMLKAKKEAEKIIKNANSTINNEREMIYKEASNLALDIAISASKKLLKKKELDDEDKLSLERFIKESEYE